MPENITLSVPDAVLEYSSPATVVDLSSPDMQLIINQRAAERASSILAERQHAAEIVNLATRLIGGTPEQPTGLPVAHDRLTAFLQALPADLYPEAEAILSAAATRDPIQYNEIGHSRAVQGTQPLPDAMKPALKAWLAAGSSLDEFFEANSVELGAMADYNLTEYVGKDGK